MDENCLDSLKWQLYFHKFKSRRLNGEFAFYLFTTMAENSPHPKTKTKNTKKKTRTKNKTEMEIG